MGLKSFVIRIAASFIAHKIQRDRKNALKDQNTLDEATCFKGKKYSIR